MAFNTNNTNNNQAAQNPFWEWVRSLENNNNNHFSGEGVDHPAYGEYPRQDFSFWGPPPPPPPPGQSPHHSGEHPPPPPPPFGGFGGPWGAGFFGVRGGGFGGWRHGGPGMHTHGHGPHGPHGHGPHGFGRRGRHGRRRDGSPSQDERSVSPRGERTEGEGEESGEPRERSRRAHCRHGPRGPHAAHDRRGRGFGRHGFGGRRGPPPFGGPFDMGGLMAALASHPYAQALRGYAAQTGETLVPEDADAENSFTPPIDIFSTEKAYVLHVSLPGAKKEDVGVNFDADRSELNVAGVVYRQGDEEFLKTLTKVERKVGMFERTIKLPPTDSEEKEEVDGDGITAKLEDGVLIVTVPKIEKEWTEVKKVDIA